MSEKAAVPAQVDLGELPRRLVQQVEGESDSVTNKLISHFTILDIKSSWNYSPTLCVVSIHINDQFFNVNCISETLVNAQSYPI